MPTLSQAHNSNEQPTILSKYSMYCTVCEWLEPIEKMTLSLLCFIHLTIDFQSPSIVVLVCSTVQYSTTQLTIPTRNNYLENDVIMSSCAFAVFSLLTVCHPLCEISRVDRIDGTRRGPRCKSHVKLYHMVATYCTWCTCSNHVHVAVL